MNQVDCENIESVVDCVFTEGLGCHEECAYEVGICQACGCVVIEEDCVTPAVVEQSQNAPMRVDVFVSDTLSVENQMIEGVDDAYVYIGITMFALMLIGAVCFMVYKYHRRQKKLYVEMDEENINALQMNEIEVEEFGTR